ncbi:MAG: DotU family type IV/VI secretion system protein [Polyangiaceae bacterium]
MARVCEEPLTLAAQLGLGALAPSARALREHLGQLFQAMHGRAQVEGIAPEDAADAQFAIVALVDEILVQQNWPGRREWQSSPLQFAYFRDNTAGENFFRRADVLVQQPHRAHVLLVYFYCLGLGFQGRYALSGGADLRQISDRIARVLEPHLAPAEPLSPHAVPSDGGRSLLRREAPLVRISLGFALFALLLFLGLRGSLSLTVAGVTDRMQTFAKAGTP